MLFSGPGHVDQVARCPEDMEGVERKMNTSRVERGWGSHVCAYEAALTPTYALHILPQNNFVACNLCRTWCRLLEGT